MIGTNLAILVLFIFTFYIICHLLMGFCGLERVGLHYLSISICEDYIRRLNRLD